MRELRGEHNEAGAFMVELALTLPIFLGTLLFLIVFALGAASVGTLSRDAYIASLLSEQHPLTTTIPLTSLIVGHPTASVKNQVMSEITTQQLFDPNNLKDVGFVNYVAGQAVRRHDAVGFTSSTDYFATGVTIAPVSGTTLEQRSVLRRMKAFGYTLTLRGSFFGLL